MDLRIQPTPKGDELNYTIKITPAGGSEAAGVVPKFVLYPRTATGEPSRSASMNGKPVTGFTDTALVIPKPPRDREIRVTVKTRQEP